MIASKFDFDASLDRAVKLVMETQGFSSELEAMDLAMVIVRRDSAVCLMANSEPLSEQWDKASERIAQQDEILAAVGLA